MKPGKELLFCALGGSGEIGMNVNLYGCNGKWLMVDLGMTFSDPWYPGVDLVFADLDFIEERSKDLLGIVLTHAHEDHIGAVPYFAQDLGVGQLFLGDSRTLAANEQLALPGKDFGVDEVGGADPDVVDVVGQAGDSSHVDWHALFLASIQPAPVLSLP